MLYFGVCINLDILNKINILNGGFEKVIIGIMTKTVDIIYNQVKHLVIINA